jgi:hypothetical protein
MLSGEDGVIVTTKDMRICISSPPDREKLVAEIFFGDEQWAELNQESGTLELEFYPKPSSKFCVSRRLTYEMAACLVSFRRAVWTCI